MKGTSCIVYGIRHHGPGSTKRLQKALHRQGPDCLLIEAPQDVSDSLHFIGHDGIQPPVALLAYHPNDLTKAAYLPFAHFSPEWQAARYALKQGIDLRAIDLPLGISLYLNFDGPQLHEASPPWINDPLGYMARLAGYTDAERWWEVTFEEEENDILLFESIIELMKTLRKEIGSLGQEENMIREAFMRKQIIKAVKEGHQNIAVVCGAWHAPALSDYPQYDLKADNQRLKGLKKASLQSTWIPWSYERLSKGTGYGAGVTAPAWYDLLFNRRGETSIRWMIKAGRLLRKEQMDISVAHIQEAVRLADTLAIIRGRKLAGIDELEAGAISVFFQGNERGLDVIRERLVMGDKIGRVPKDVPQMPIQKDLTQAIKSARLTKEFTTSETISKEFDLRKPANLAASQLLHRLGILGIPWGQLKKRRQSDLGRFRENWTLKWRPDYALRVIEAGMYGNTIAEAATGYIANRLKEIDDLSELTQLLDQVLKGDLKEAVADLLAVIRDGAALQRDLQILMQSVIQMVGILRYGTNYEKDELAIRKLVQEMVPRICAGLHLSAAQLNGDMAYQLLRTMQEFQGALSVYHSIELKASWQEVVHRLIGMDQIHPTIRGWSTRSLLDQGKLNIQHAIQWMAQALSSSVPPQQQVEWLEGFLQGSGLLLIYQVQLWQLINAWVDRQEMETFQLLLPVLRRAFSAFSERERELMLHQVRNNGVGVALEMKQEEYDPERIAILSPGIDRYLGK